MLLHIDNRAVLIPEAVQVLHLDESVGRLVDLDTRHHLLHLRSLLDTVTLLLNALECLRQLCILLEHFSELALCLSEVVLRLLVLLVDRINCRFGLLK